MADFEITYLLYFPKFIYCLVACHNGALLAQTTETPNVSGRRPAQLLQGREVAQGSAEMFQRPIPLRNAHRLGADATRLFLGEILLEILSQKDRVPLTTLLKILPILLKVMVGGAPRITTLMTRVLQNSQYNHDGIFVGRAQMILGLLYKAKKKRAIALQHLTEANRVLAIWTNPDTRAGRNSACGTGTTALSRWSESAKHIEHGQGPPDPFSCELTPRGSRRSRPSSIIAD
jgi:hypothetical protein